MPAQAFDAAAYAAAAAARTSSNQASKACIFCELSGLFLVVFGVLHTAVFKQQLSASAWSFYITLFGNNFRVLILLW